MGRALVLAYFVSPNKDQLSEYKNKKKNMYIIQLEIVKEKDFIFMIIIQFN
jgi:hypothetical protein